MPSKTDTLADAYVQRGLRHRLPGLRRRRGLPVPHLDEGRNHRYGRAGRHPFPGGLHDAGPLRPRRQEGIRAGPLLLQQFREHLLNPARLEGRRQPSGFPADPGRRRNGENRHHRGRPGRLSGHVPLQPHGRQGPPGQLRALSGQGGAGRPQRTATAGDRARRLHRPHLGDPHLPVARLRHRRTRHPAGRQRHGLPSRRTLARGGRLVDQTRQGGLGLVEHLEPLRRGLQVGNQQRNL